MQRRAPVFLVCGDPTIRPDDPEPALRELLDDPLLVLLLKSDRVRPADLLRVIERARARLKISAPVEVRGTRIGCEA